MGRPSHLQKIKLWQNIAFSRRWGIESFCLALSTIPGKIQDHLMLNNIGYLFGINSINLEGTAQIEVFRNTVHRQSKKHFLSFKRVLQTIVFKF